VKELVKRPWAVVCIVAIVAVSIVTISLALIFSGNADQLVSIFDTVAGALGGQAARTLITRKP